MKNVNLFHARGRQSVNDGLAPTWLGIKYLEACPQYTCCYDTLLSTYAYLVPSKKWHPNIRTCAMKGSEFDWISTASCGANLPGSCWLKWPLWFVIRASTVATRPQDGTFSWHKGLQSASLGSCLTWLRGAMTVGRAMGARMRSLMVHNQALFECVCSSLITGSCSFVDGRISEIGTRMDGVTL